VVENLQPPSVSVQVEAVPVSDVRMMMEVVWLASGPVAVVDISQAVSVQVYVELEEVVPSQPG